MDLTREKVAIVSGVIAVMCGVVFIGMKSGEVRRSYEATLEARRDALTTECRAKGGVPIHDDHYVRIERCEFPCQEKR
jgi:hypothetical protein